MKKLILDWLGDLRDQFTVEVEEILNEENLPESIQDKIECFRLALLSDFDEVLENVKLEGGGDE